MSVADCRRRTWDWICRTRGWSGRARDPTPNPRPRRQGPSTKNSGETFGSWAGWLERGAGFGSARFVGFRLSREISRRTTHRRRAPPPLAVADCAVRLRFGYRSWFAPSCFPGDGSARPPIRARAGSRCARSARTSIIPRRSRRRRRRRPRERRRFSDEAVPIRLEDRRVSGGRSTAGLSARSGSPTRVETRSPRRRRRPSCAPPRSGSISRALPRRWPARP